jgi:hypothetical protein
MPAIIGMESCMNTVNCQKGGPMNRTGKIYLIILLLFSFCVLVTGRSIYAGEANVTFGVG